MTLLRYADKRVVNNIMKVYIDILLIEKRVTDLTTENKSGQRNKYYIPVTQMPSLVELISLYYSIPMEMVVQVVNLLQQQTSCGGWG